MKLIVSAIVLASLAVAPASAATIYTSPSSFTLATTNPTNINFNGILSPGALFAAYGSLTVSGITFTTPDAGVNIDLTKADFYPAHVYPGDFIVNSVNANANNQVNIAFLTPVEAFGIYYGAVNGGGIGTFTLSDGTVYQDTSLPGLGVLGFAGFVSSSPITSLSYVVTNDSWIAESLVLATPANIVSTPEPGSGSLILAAAATLLCAAAVIRRKRRARS